MCVIYSLIQVNGVSDINWIKFLVMFRFCIEISIGYQRQSMVAFM